MMGRNSIDVAGGPRLGGNAPKNSQGPKDAAFWEEKFLRLREEHAALKRQSNEQQTTMRQMHTKLQLIDKTMAAKEQNQQANGPMALGNSRGPQGKTKDDREADALIQSLRKENDRLRRENRDLREQIRTAPPVAPGNRRKVAPSAARPRPKSAGGDGNAVATLRKQLLSMETRIRKLHEENNALRRRVHHRGQQPGAENDTTVPNRPGTKNIGGEAGEVFAAPSARNGTFSAKDADLLTRELQDKEAQIRIVKNRYEHLEAKARAAAEIHERTVHMMEEGNRTIRDLRRKIQALQHDNEQLALHQQRAEDLALELATTKEEAHRLETRITALCESPFINDAFESRSKVDKLLGLERADRQQKVQIEHLKETAKMHHAEILALKSSAEQLCKQRDHLSQENHALKLKLEQVERGSSVLEDKMRLYSGEAGVDASELERALTLVKRGSEAMSQVGFLETAPASDRKLQDLQMTHLSTCRDLEMAERMLKAQTAINRDLNEEISDLQRKVKGSNNELLRKLEDYETLCARRLQKIHALEAQIKQLLKKAKKQASSASSPRQGRRDDARDDDDAISIVSLAASASDFGPGENLIEIWIKDAKLDETKLEQAATTFVMLDFYDYETQTSPLVSGLTPNFNFAATYRVAVDHFLLRYMASDTLTLELNRTRHGDFELLGQTALSLRPLLHGSGKWQVDDAQIISVRDGSVLGTFTICIRLALPIEALFETYLREVPGERERIERLKVIDQEHEDAAIARARAQNQLEITILGCEGLPAKDRALPSPFVHFQLLSFPDTFTPILQNTADPVFDYRAPFPLLVDDKLLRYLEREKLEINVLNDDDDDNDMDGRGTVDDDLNGLLGKTVIPLAKLAQGKAVSGRYPLRDVDGCEAGTVEIRLAWRSPLLTVEDAGLNDVMALSEDHLQQVIRKFNTDGAVDWRRFLRSANDRVQGIRMRLCTAIERAEDGGIHAFAACRHLDKDGDGFITRADLGQALEDLGVSVTEEELDDFLLAIDEGRQGRVSYSIFLQAVEAPSAGEQKVVKALRILQAKEVDLERPFQRRQVEGLLSTRDFCRVLRDLGFRLHEHETLLRDPREESDFEEEGDDEDKISTRPVRVGPEHTARRQGPDRQDNAQAAHREHEIHANAQPAHVELYERKKLEFQDRLARAAQATEEVTAGSYAEREALLGLYGTGADNSATRLQSNFRSYWTRSQLREGETKAALSGSGSGAGAIVDAEDVLRHALAQKSSSFDLRAALAARDKRRSGYIPAGHFVRALVESELEMQSSQAMALALCFAADHDDSTEARAHEDADNDTQNPSRRRRQVDYNEFVRFARFQPRNVSGLTFQICNALLQVRSPAIFYEVDVQRRGVVSRRAFAKALRANVPSLSSYDAKVLMDIFDADSNGEVDYRAFVRFAQGQSVAVALASVEARLRDRIQAMVDNGIQISQAFEHFDKNKDGKISRVEFSKALRSLRIDVNRKESQALFSRFDPKRKGMVSYKDFVKFLHAKESGERIDLMDPANIDDQALSAARKRLQNITRNALAAGMTLHGPFEHYDWTRTGSIAPIMFERACGMLGLPLTHAEIQALASKFASKDGRKVNYQAFVEWTLVDRVLARDVVDKLRTMGEHSRITTVFEHFDPEKKGEVTRKDFQAGLAQLGLDGLGQEERIALFEQFDRDGDGFIQYHEFAKVLRAGNTSGPGPSGTAVSPRVSVGQNSARSHPESPRQGEILAREDLRKLRAALEIRDVAFTGKLSAEAFGEALAEVGVENGDLAPLTDAEGNVLYKRFLKQQEGNQEYIDAVFRKVCKLIANRAAAAGGDLSVPFAHFNQDGSPVAALTYEGFKTGLEALAFDLVPAEVHALVERFDANHDGHVSFEEFAEAVRKEQSAASQTVQSPRSPRQEGVRLSEHQMMLVKRLVYAGRRRGVNFRALFAHHGAKASSLQLRKESFLAALRKVDPAVPHDALEDLALVLDTESTGVVEYARLLHLAECESGSALAVAQLGEQVRAMVEEQVELQGNIRVPMTHFDRRRKGHFDLEAWKRAIKDLALEAPDRVVVGLFEKINVSGSGKVDFGEFAAFIQDPEFGPQLERKIRKLIMSSVLAEEWTRDPQKEIRKFDEDGTGFVDKHGLRSAAKKLGLALSREEITRIILRFDPNGAGSAKVQAVAQWLEEQVKLARQAVTIADRLRRKLRDGGVQLQQLLTPGAGGVNPKPVFLNQLLGTSQQLGLEERDAHLLADCFVFAGTGGQVDTQECLDFVNGGVELTVAAPASPRSSSRRARRNSGVNLETSVDTAMHEFQTLLRKAHDRGVDYRKSFEHFDTDYSGQITYEDFETGLRDLGFELSKEQLGAMFARFAGSKRRTIKYRRFLHECLPADVAFVEEVADKLRHLIEKRVSRLGRGGLEKTFRHFEPDAHGQVSRHAFRRGLEVLHFDLSDSEVRALLDKFDIDGNGRISFAEFVAFAQGEDASAVPGAKRRQADRDADEIAQQLRALVRKAHQKGVAYRQSFEHFDPHYAGFIDADDFRRGLEQLGIDVKPEHVRLLIERFAGKDSRVRYRDFLRAVAPEEEATVEEVADKFRRMLGRVASLRKAFRHFERNADGLISRKAFRDGLGHLNLELTDGEVRMIMDIFDQDGDGFISYDEFRKTISAITGSRTRKALKAALRTGKAYLDLELVGVRPSGRSKTLGRTRVDLVELLEEMRDLDGDDLEVYDRDNRVVAKVSLSLQALDLLQVLQRRA
ncbi:Protein fantom [Hondaea fermentalgiana]|uniref:Protein fantom n=1 Tax=Hondaea fermentalgiana TaxID=2315210 RepID=A0A2R5G9Z1_9STRA|nr:Protein fantom [Hondaea fermentalgiana]|eukprot:GBG27119.1 Protein fantom [Hondaea fermentalgiana]